MENIRNTVGEEGIVERSVLVLYSQSPWFGETVDHGSSSPGSRTRGPKLDSCPAKRCDLGLVTKPSFIQLTCALASHL